MYVRYGNRAYDVRIQEVLQVFGDVKLFKEQIVRLFAFYTHLALLLVKLTFHQPR